MSLYFFSMLLSAWLIVTLQIFKFKSMQIKIYFTTIVNILELNYPFKNVDWLTNTIRRGQIGDGSRTEHTSAGEQALRDDAGAAQTVRESTGSQGEEC